MTLTTATERLGVICVDHGSPSSRSDDVAVEEPLHIRVNGESLAMTMRTPCEDRFLAVGFLFAEGLLGSLDAMGPVQITEGDDPNTIEVMLSSSTSLPEERLQRTKRSGVTSSACGVCGRESIEDLLARCPRNTDLSKVPATWILTAPTLLAEGQPSFKDTGGLHAACAIDASGEVIASAEDVGRHNAVDKVVGKLWYARRLPNHRPELGPTLLCVSGRASFEILQKSAMAGFHVVASISAPSSLAVETAHAAGITLASFVRGERFSLYAHAERVI